MTRNTISKGGNNTVEDRFFICSLSGGVPDFSQAVWGHWTVESFQRHLDVTFRQDHYQIIDKSAALNLNIPRKFAIVILKNMDIEK